MHLMSVSSIAFSSRYITPFFFFNDTATTEIYTLSLHDALPISPPAREAPPPPPSPRPSPPRSSGSSPPPRPSSRPPPSTSAAGMTGPYSIAYPRVGRRSEEHTSELQSLAYLVCRLLLEKKKIYN